MVKKILVANWKMFPETAREAIDIFRAIKKTAITAKNVETIICAPTVFLEKLSEEVTERIAIGAQDVFYEESGSQTGEISPLMLRDIGVRHAIIGHSSRRKIGETDDDVAKKVLICIKNSIIPIVCIGELSREKNNYINFVGNQIKESIKLIPPEAIPQIIFTYEPVWGISDGSFHAATARDAYEMKLFIRKVLSDVAGDYAKKVKILYGGSANSENTKELLEQGQVDGLLVGAASRDPQAFGDMIHIVNSI